MIRGRKLTIADRLTVLATDVSFGMLVGAVVGFAFVLAVTLPL